MHRVSSRTAAFSLIEILVVIAIIAVLTAIVIPTYGHVRTVANRTASASNLRQWGIALQLHLQETRGRLPWEVVKSSSDRPSWAEVDNPDYATCWFNALPPYVGQSPLSATPAVDRDRNNKSPSYLREGSLFYAAGADVEASRRSLANKPTFCYMMNSQIYSNASPQEGGVKMRDDPKGMRISAFPDGAKLSRIAFMTESVLDPQTERPTGGEDYNSSRAKGDGTAVTARYGGRTNISFLDGSVRTYDSDYVVKRLGGKYVRADKPEIAWAVWEYPW